MRSSCKAKPIESRLFLLASTALALSPSVVSCYRQSFKSRNVYNDTRVTNIDSASIDIKTNPALKFFKGVFGNDLLDGASLPSHRFHDLPTPGDARANSVWDLNITLDKLVFSTTNDGVEHSVTRMSGGVVDTVVCVFVNPSSGGRSGADILSLGQGLELGRVHELILRMEVSSINSQSTWMIGRALNWFRPRRPNKNKIIQVLFFDMLSDCSRAAGKYTIHRLLNRDASRNIESECLPQNFDVDSLLSNTTYESSDIDVRAVVAGGDGTVTWLIDELRQSVEPIIMVPLGVIPLGTGNDLSRQLNTPVGQDQCKGGGYAEALVNKHSIVGDKLDSMMQLMAKFALAPQSIFDLWEVVLDTHPGGNIQEMRQGNLVTVGSRCQKAVGGRCERMRQTMGNYASVGFESLIGLEFEKWRSQQQHNSQFDNKLQYVKLGAAYTFGGILNKSESADFPGLAVKPLKDFVQRLWDSEERYQINQKVSSYGCNPSDAGWMGSYRSLVFMNVECIMGGERKWPTAAALPAQPAFDDRLLEALSFQMPISMAALDGKVFNSCAVGQYSRPEVIFQPDTTTPFQVDGEFYAALLPKSFRISHMEQIHVIRIGKGNKEAIGGPTIDFVQ